MTLPRLTLAAVVLAAACRTPPPQEPPPPAAAAPPPVVAESPLAPAQAPEPPPGPVAASPDVYKVLAESESARLLLATWQPGQRDAMHAHPEFIVYTLTDMRWKSILLDGRESTGSAKAGEVLAPGAGLPGHAVLNVGDAPAAVLILERKPGAAQPMPEGSVPSAVDASPDRHAVLADTAWVRVIRATWDPRQRDANHAHPELFSYALTRGKWSVRTGPGKRQRFVTEAGTVQHLPPNPGHSVKNVGGESASVLLFELK
ncbi:MAG: hypothetical protein OXT09_21700 [Myxococcales bacterium]|nr:hypothetical protein [Myxococcales bacterium]